MAERHLHFVLRPIDIRAHGERTQRTADIGDNSTLRPGVQHSCQGPSSLNASARSLWRLTGTCLTTAAACSTPDPDAAQQNVRMSGSARPAGHARSSRARRHLFSGTFPNNSGRVGRIPEQLRRVRDSAAMKMGVNFTRVWVCGSRGALRLGTGDKQEVHILRTSASLKCEDRPGSRGIF